MLGIGSGVFTTLGSGMGSSSKEVREYVRGGVVMVGAWRPQGDEQGRNWVGVGSGGSGSLGWGRFVVGSGRWVG